MVGKCERLPGALRESEGRMAGAELPRRHFLLAAGSVGMATALHVAADGAPAHAQAQSTAKPLPGYASFKNAEALIVHSSSTIELRREHFGAGGITPEEVLYVRNNVAPPKPDILADRDAWEVEIDGVAKPGKMKMGELKRLGLAQVAMVLQCSGNGRGYFASKPSGTPWQVGAVGNVLWSGVPLRAVVNAMGGLASGRRFITGTGGEPIPQGLDPRTVVVERSVPIAELDDALLAFEVNGRPVSLAHGGPVRLVIPGYYGINNVKYVKKVAFTENETAASIQASRYRVAPLGQKEAPTQQSCWEMNVKSFITHPLRTSPQGAVLIYGVAFAGKSGVKGVEVSTDGGKTWSAAQFVGPDMGKFAWRTFVHSANLGAGTHTIASRATDVAGNVQPENLAEENVGGYGHNGWRAHAVDVTVA
jgi:sulfite oxidase